MSDGLFDDEYDPLAPMLGGEDVGEDEDSAKDSSVSGRATENPLGVGLGLVEDGESSVDTGVTDSERLVRLWFDDEGLLTKVRVSPVWFSRLGRGKSLADAFNEAFFRERLDRVKAARLEEIERRGDLEAEKSRINLGDLVQPEELHGLERLSINSLGEYLSLFSVYDSLLPEGPVRSAAEGQPRKDKFVGRHAGVCVTVDGGGFPMSVDFDEDWLDSAQVKAICTGVVEAAQNAYAGVEPIVDEPSIQEKVLAKERELLIAGLYRLLNYGGK